MSVGRPLGDKAYGCGGGTHVKGYINDWMGIVERVIYTVSGFNLYLLVILCFFLHLLLVSLLSLYKSMGLHIYIYIYIYDIIIFQRVHAVANCIYMLI